jgi:hypothetical protein
MLYAAPEVAAALLDKTAQMTIRYLVAQVRAGAQAIQLFDTWAGLVSASDYAAFALPYAPPCSMPSAARASRRSTWLSTRRTRRRPSQAAVRTCSVWIGAPAFRMRRARSEARLAFREISTRASS